MRRIAILSLSLVLAASAGAGEYVRIDGTNVSLRVPEGFELSRDFPGLGRDADLTSVLVTQLQMPFQLSRASFSADALARRGVQLHRKADVEVARRTGELLHATQRANGIEFRKWLLLFGDERTSVLLTATTPLDLEAVHQEALVETLSTARWDPNAPVSPTQGLRFRVREVAPLRIVSSAPNAIVLSDPMHGTGRGIPPLVVVGSSLGRVQIANLAVFARERLMQTVSIEAVEVSSQTSRSLDGLPGHEIRAVARDVESQRPVHVTQLLATDGEHYYLLQGIADAENDGAFASLLERVIDSFAFVE